MCGEVGFTCIRMSVADTYCFEYNGHAEEGIGELHGHEQGYDEITFTTAHTVVLQR